MNKGMNREISPESMEKVIGGAVVAHNGKYWVVEDPPTRGAFLYYTSPFDTVEEAEEKARKLGWSTGWFTKRSFEAYYNRKLNL